MLIMGRGLILQQQDFIQVAKSMRIGIINVHLYEWNGMTQIKINMLFHMMNLTLTAEW